MALMVNGELVEDGRFIQAFRQLGGFELDAAREGAQQEEAQVRRIAERRVVSEVLLCQMARSAGLNVSDAELNHRRARQWGTSSASVCGPAVQRELGDGALLEKFCQWLTRHEPRPSRTEVGQYYLRHRHRFRIPECVRVAQIICNVDAPAQEEPARRRIQLAEEDLNRGTAFAKVAATYSDCGGKTILGWVARGSMVPEFEQTVFALQPGGPSTIFRTVFGFHIVTVLERKAEGFESLEEIRPVLARRMHEERQQRVIDAAIERALRTAVLAEPPAEPAPAPEERL